MAADVDRRVPQTSRTFGTLRKAVFLEKNMSIVTKEEELKYVCFDCSALTAQSYGLQQATLAWAHHQARKKWGGGGGVMLRQPLRRSVRMPEPSHDAREVLFSWHSKPRLRCGPKKRWRDVCERSSRILTWRRIGVWIGKEFQSQQESNVHARCGKMQGRILWKPLNVRHAAGYLGKNGIRRGKGVWTNKEESGWTEWSSLESA